MHKKKISGKLLSTWYFTNSVLLNTKHWHSIPQFTLSPLINTSQSMLLTQLHTTTGRSRCGGRQQRPHEASLCCAPECLVGHNIVHDLSSMCKKGVFMRLHGTCFPNNKTTSKKQETHPKHSWHETSASGKSISFGSFLRACAEWAWTDGLCLRLRYGRTIRNATCNSWIGVVPLKPKLACAATMAYYCQKYQE